MSNEKEELAPSTAAFVQQQEALKAKTYGIHADLERQFHTAPGEEGEYWYYIGVGYCDGKIKTFMDGPYTTMAEAEVAAHEVVGMMDYDTVALKTRDKQRAKGELEAYLAHTGLHGEKMNIVTAMGRKTRGRRMRGEG